MNKKLFSFLALFSIISAATTPTSVALASDDVDGQDFDDEGLHIEEFVPCYEEIEEGYRGECRCEEHHFPPIHHEPPKERHDEPPVEHRQEPPAGYEDEVITVFKENPFSDTNIDELSGRAAAELYRRAVIGGYPDGEFKGFKPVNRAEAAKFLLLSRFGEVDEVVNDGQFKDVLDDQWYTKYVVTAADKGIIIGHPDGSFRPADTVNMAELLKMLSITFELEENLPYEYEDVSEDQWFAKYAGVAEKYELFPNRSSRLMPAKELTREEVAIAIYQFLANR